MAKKGVRQKKSRRAPADGKAPRTYEHKETPTPPSKVHHVYALSPQRDHLEIRFPRVTGYARRISASAGVADAIVPAEGEDAELPLYGTNRPAGSTRDVDFWTSKAVREAERTHLNGVVADTEKWEQSVAYYLDTDEHVIAFVKNFNLGFAIPYSYPGETREYLPDFLVRVQKDGREVGTLILETKGYDPAAMARIEGAHRWIAAVNAEGSCGRWAYRCLSAPTDVPTALRSAAHELTLPPRPHWRAALNRFVEEMRKLYGGRLQGVVLYGSRARGDAVVGSDIDTLVVLDPCDDFWAELDRISPIATRVSADHDIVVSAFPVDVRELENGGSPLMRNARREGVRVG